MNNNRTSPRTDLLYYLKIYNKSRTTIIGRLGDISENGLMILSNEEIILNVKQIVHLDLPKGHKFNRETITLTIETLWSKPDYKPGYFCTGCKFSDLTPEDIVIITSLMKLYSLRPSIFT